MIFDKIPNFIKYQCVHNHFIDILKFLDAEPIADRPDGRYEINHQGSYVAIESYQTKDTPDCFIECHRKYIDVQIMIDGVEGMGVCRKSECDEPSPYDEEKDLQKLKGDADMLTFRAGSFMVFFPDDAHMPKIKYGDSSGMVRKAVFKVPV
ncbi:MAG: YhcH/YjgK/YiaL family protein [Nitrospirae bacterium]|nr:YhcH/YjgK/YiaL family protein [Nitrospirota bacterium]